MKLRGYQAVQRASRYQCDRCGVQADESPTRLLPVGWRKGWQPRGPALDWCPRCASEEAAIGWARELLRELSAIRAELAAPTPAASRLLRRRNRKG